LQKYYPISKFTNFTFSPLNPFYKLDKELMFQPSYALNYLKGEDKIATFVDKKSMKGFSFIWNKDLKASFDVPIASYNNKLIAVSYSGDENPTLIFLSLKQGW